LNKIKQNHFFKPSQQVILKPQRNVAAEVQNALMMQKRKMVGILPPPPISNPIDLKLQEKILEKKFLREHPIAKNVTQALSNTNTTNITNRNTTNANAVKVTQDTQDSQFGEIKFIQSKEKITSKKVESSNESINDEMIEQIFETSKKQLINLLKKKNIKIPMTVQRSSNKNIQSDNSEKKIHLLEQKISKLDATVSKLEKRLESDEKNSSKTSGELNQIKKLLEGNFQRLDKILSTLSKNNIK